MFDVISRIMIVQVPGEEFVFPIPLAQRGIISRIILTEVESNPMGIPPILDLFESNRVRDYSSSSGGHPTEDNEEHSKTYDPHCYKICPQMTGVSQGGKGLLEVFAESGGYSFFCQDHTKPAIGQGGTGGQSTKTIFGKIVLPGATRASTWNLSIQAITKG